MKNYVMEENKRLGIACGVPLALFLGSLAAGGMARSAPAETASALAVSAANDEFDAQLDSAVSEEAALNPVVEKILYPYRQPAEENPAASATVASETTTLKPVVEDPVTEAAEDPVTEVVEGPATEVTVEPATEVVLEPATEVIIDEQPVITAASDSAPMDASPSSSKPSIADAPTESVPEPESFGEAEAPKQEEMELSDSISVPPAMDDDTPIIASVEEATDVPYEPIEESAVSAVKTDDLAISSDLAGDPAPSLPPESVAIVTEEPESETGPIGTIADTAAEIPDVPDVADVADGPETAMKEAGETNSDPAPSQAPSVSNIASTSSPQADQPSSLPSTPMSPSAIAAPTKPFLGVGIRDATNSIVTTLYEGSTAQRLGVIAGDEIVAVNDTSITNIAALRAYLDSQSVGDAITIVVKRADSTYRLGPIPLEGK